MVDFYVCKCCVELYIDVALPWRKLEGRHRERVAGYLSGVEVARIWMRNDTLCYRYQEVGSMVTYRLQYGT
jgi:hypothetical protein